MSKQQKALTAREKRFCEVYAATGDAVQSAQAAGYEQPDKAGAALMNKEAVNEAVSRLLDSRLKNARQKAYAGYERIAFGSVNDAVRLLFEGEAFGTAPEGYDLFNVAEIRRPKEGAMEIKFFDRLKALEKLEQYGQEDEKSPAGFYQALVGGLAQLSSGGEERDT